MAELLGALDQGTTSTRFIVFDRFGKVVSLDRREHRQIFPRPGWVEHDPVEIWSRSVSVIEGALARGGLAPGDLAAVGVANQRETTVLWERATGRPVANAVVWQDTRTARLCRELEAGEGPDRFRSMTGLPLATYFAGPKARWLIDHLDLRQAAERGDIAFGTIDSWLIWNLTGGAGSGLHITDPTNASRTMLMDLATTSWNADLSLDIGVPTSVLPEIMSSVGELGRAVGPLDGVPVAAVLGDQQAAMFGQACFLPGEAKNTYGTGNFLLLNTGDRPVRSDSGLVTTVAFRHGRRPPVYALEGSVAVTGALVQWLRDNLGIVERSADIEELAAGVADNGDVYIVPAFSGLFAPHWRPDARGVIVGLTSYATKGHLARAALEATAYQTRDVLEAMETDSGVRLGELRVDGGMTGNELLMQFQADLLGVEVVRPATPEVTALGAAFAAGLGVGVYRDLDEIRSLWVEDRRWSPRMVEEERDRLHHRWKEALERSFSWV